MKSAKQLYLSIKQLQFNKKIMRQSYEIKRKAVIFLERRKPRAEIKTRDTSKGTIEHLKRIIYSKRVLKDFGLSESQIYAAVIEKLYIDCDTSFLLRKTYLKNFSYWKYMLKIIFGT